MASQIIGFWIVSSNVNSATDQSKHQSSASLAFVRGIHQSPVNSLHKGPVTQKIFPFHDIIMGKVNFPQTVHNRHHIASPWGQVMGASFVNSVTQSRVIHSIIFMNFHYCQNSGLTTEYQVHIWQVSLQLSCGDTCQILKWFKELCAKLNISLEEKLMNGALVTPWQPWSMLRLCHRYSVCYIMFYRAMLLRDGICLVAVAIEMIVACKVRWVVWQMKS